LAFSAHIKSLIHGFITDRRHPKISIQIHAGQAVRPQAYADRQAGRPVQNGTLKSKNQIGSVLVSGKSTQTPSFLG
jgi:hypothetical protein